MTLNTKPKNKKKKIPDLGDHSLEPAPEEVRAHRGVNDGRGRVLFLQLGPPSHRSDTRLKKNTNTLMINHVRHMMVNRDIRL